MRTALMSRAVLCKQDAGAPTFERVILVTGGAGFMYVFGGLYAVGSPKYYFVVLQMGARRGRGRLFCPLVQSCGRHD